MEHDRDITRIIQKELVSSPEGQYQTIYSLLTTGMSVVGPRRVEVFADGVGAVMEGLDDIVALVALERGGYELIMGQGPQEPTISFHQGVFVGQVIPSILVSLHILQDHWCEGMHQPIINPKVARIAQFVRASKGLR